MRIAEQTEKGSRRAGCTAWPWPVSSLPPVRAAAHATALPFTATHSAAMPHAAPGGCGSRCCCSSVCTSSSCAAGCPPRFSSCALLRGQGQHGRGGQMSSLYNHKRTDLRRTDHVVCNTRHASHCTHPQPVALARRRPPPLLLLLLPAAASTTPSRTHLQRCCGLPQYGFKCGVLAAPAVHQYCSVERCCQLAAVPRQQHVTCWSKEEEGGRTNVWSERTAHATCLGQEGRKGSRGNMPQHPTTGCASQGMSQHPARRTSPSLCRSTHRWALWQDHRKPAARWRPLKALYLLLPRCCRCCRRCRCPQPVHLGGAPRGCARTQLPQPPALP